MKNAYVGLLRNHGFRNLWLGQVTSQIALNMLYFVLAIRVYAQTQSNAAVSLLLLSFGVPAIVFGVIAGGIVDHYDKRTIMIFCNGIRALLLVVFFFLTKNLFALYLLSLIVSILTQLFIPAEAPSIPSLVKKEQLLGANSLMSTSYYLSIITGFVIAGPSLVFFGPKYVYLVISFLLILSTYFVYLLPSIQANLRWSGSIITITEILHSLKEGLQFIQSNARISQALLLMTFSQALIATLSVLAPGFADTILSINLTDASFVVMGPSAVGLIVGSLWVGAYGGKFLRGKIILIGVLMTAFTLILLSFITSESTMFGVRTLVIAVILLTLLGVWNAFVSIPANTILQQDSQNTMRSRVYGVLTSMTGGISIIPVIFSGILADEVGVAKAMFFVGLLVGIFGVFSLLREQGRKSTIG